MHELIQLWEKTLGAPPAERQFILWTESHAADIVRKAILKTAAKNLSIGATMTLDHQVRFASKVMLTLSGRREEHKGNRARLEAEFGPAAYRAY